MLTPNDNPVTSRQEAAPVAPGGARRRLGRVATGVAAAAGLGFGTFAVGPAANALPARPTQPIQPTHWDITPTGPFTGTGSFASFSGSEGTAGECLVPPGSIGLSGSVPASMVPGNPAQLANLQSLDLNGCSFGGVELDVKFASGAELNGISYDPGTGVTTGFIEDIHGTVTGATCTASLSGSLSASYANATGELAIDPGGNDTLTVESSSGCIGLPGGGHVGVNATFALSPEVQITGG